SSFIESLVLGRLGMFLALLFLAYHPVVAHKDHPFQAWFFAILFGTLNTYLLADMYATYLRLQLLDRPIRMPRRFGDFYVPRLMILAVLNLLQVIISFATFYQLFFFVFVDPPLVGDALPSRPGNPPTLLPLDSLYFSTVCLTTLGFGDIRPANTFFRC